MPVGQPITIAVTGLDPGFYGPDPVAPSPFERDGPARDAANIRDGLFASPPSAGLNPTWAIETVTAQPRAHPTRAGVLAALADARRIVRGPGDTLFLYYAGHGVRIPAGIIADAPVDALCLSDGFLLEQELTAAWQGFGAGTRVLFIADCCHSGDLAHSSVIRRAVDGVKAFMGRGSPDDRLSPRGLPEERVRAVATAHAPALIANLAAAMNAGGGDDAALATSALVFAACGADQLAATLKGESRFTANLIGEWYRPGQSIQNYADYCRVVVKKLGSSSQMPCIVPRGRADAGFLNSTRPFTA